jgi:hypothetical protein
MTLPAAATKANLDAATDDPSQARAELVALIDKFNALLAALPTDFATSAQGTKADNALPASSYTAADVLTKTKTVDGSGSGLDADLLDGQHGSYYQPAASAITTGNISGQSVSYAATAGASGVVANVVLGAPASSINITGLNGDSHEFYEITVYGKGPSTYIRLQFNGDAGTNYGFWTSLGTGTQTKLLFGFADTIGSISRLMLQAKSGTSRLIQILGTSAPNGGAATYIYGAGYWTNTAANITSMQISIDSGNFEAGSRVIVTKAF